MKETQRTLLLTVEHGAIEQRLKQENLSTIWREAEQWGEVKMEQQSSVWAGDDGEKKYKAQINFDRKGGSTIWARGYAPTPEQALINAIVEALKLKDL